MDRIELHGPGVDNRGIHPRATAMAEGRSVSRIGAPDNNADSPLYSGKAKYVNLPRAYSGIVGYTCGSSPARTPLEEWPKDIMEA